MSTATDPDLRREVNPPDDPGPAPVPRTAAELPADDDRSPASEETPQSAWERFNSFEARGMPPPAEQTLTDTHSCARLLSSYSDHLVVASTPAADFPPVIYVADPGTGLVSCRPDRILALSMAVADDLLSDYEELYTMVARAEADSVDAEAPPPLPSRRAVINHARGLRSARAPERHQKVVGGVLLHDMQMGGTLASRLTVVPHAQLDADMSVIGTARGCPRHPVPPDPTSLFGRYTFHQPEYRGSLPPLEMPGTSTWTGYCPPLMRWTTRAGQDSSCDGWAGI